MRFIVKGFTGPHPDFTDTIDLPGDFDFEAVNYGSATTHAMRAALKAALLDSQCPTDYLDVLDECDVECRSDLADTDTQHVLLAESLGCDNCQDPDGDGSGNGCNDYTDGCSDAPHGGYMLTFDPIKCAECDGPGGTLCAECALHHAPAGT